MLRKLIVAAFVLTFAGGAAFAQETCETKAVGKDGKPLAGAAKTSFMKKCTTDTCATKAVSSDGKPLAGAAKTSFMKKCEKGAWAALCNDIADDSDRRRALRLKHSDDRPQAVVWSGTARNCFSPGAFQFIEHLEGVMNSIIYLIGLIVVVGVILSFLGLR
jgi:hypothetical protein